jgi:hypothetical protein
MLKPLKGKFRIKVIITFVILVLTWTNPFILKILSFKKYTLLTLKSLLFIKSLIIFTIS